jgi:segregation and condensation protein A
VTYEVRLEVFEGPIDLLLHLITKQRVDIYDVSLATITDEYLGAVAALGDLDLESATGFLVVAATLLELKSARLLPAPGAGDEGSSLLEERDLLLSRLVECATYREAGAWIAAALRAGEGYHGRAVALEPAFLERAPDVLANTSLERVARAAAALLAPRPELQLDVSHVAPMTASVADAILEVAALLKQGSRVSFEELCGRSPERIEVVVRFLALLELFKAGAIDLEQRDRFGDITAAWTGEAEADEVLEVAEEYSVDMDMHQGGRRA